jgi:hypothetical protein
MIMALRDLYRINQSCKGFEIGDKVDIISHIYDHYNPQYDRELADWWNEETGWCHDMDNFINDGIPHEITATANNGIFVDCKWWYPYWCLRKRDKQTPLDYI